MLSTFKQTNCATTLLCVKSICVELNKVANDLLVELMNELTTTTTKKIEINNKRLLHKLYVSLSKYLFK